MEKASNSAWNQSVWNKSAAFSLGAQESEEFVTLLVVPTPAESSYSGVVHVGGGAGSAGDV